MELIGLIISIIATIAYSYYSYNKIEDVEERKKVKRNMITTGSVWISLLFLLSIPMIFITIAGKLKGH